MSLSVKLSAFEGPLDLLLHLIDKNKIDIYDIPIVEITDQYLEYVQSMDDMDMELASEFMVMAATLLDIKCRMLLPVDEDEETEEGDPRDELISRLIEYKKYKYMSGVLRDIMDDNGMFLTRDTVLPDEVAKYRPEADLDELLSDVSLDKLTEIYKDILRRRREVVDPVRSRFGKIEKEKISVADQMVRLEKQAIRDRKMSFRKCIEKQPDKYSVVVTFLAVLELMHYGKIRISQEEIFGDILIESLEEADTIVDEAAYSDSEDFS